MNTTRKTAIITFIIITAIWIFMVMHGTFGFMPPHDTHAKFADALHALIWIAFLVSAWRLYIALRSRRA